MQVELGNVEGLGGTLQRALVNAKQAFKCNLASCLAVYAT